jgi:hypothetical protein
MEFEATCVPSGLRLSDVTVSVWPFSVYDTWPFLRSQY